MAENLRGSHLADSIEHMGQLFPESVLERTALFLPDFAENTTHFRVNFPIFAMNDSINDGIFGDTEDIAGDLINLVIIFVRFIEHHHCFLTLFAVFVSST
jgi:hypothetical protein